MSARRPLAAAAVASLPVLALGGPAGAKAPSPRLPPAGPAVGDGGKEVPRHRAGRVEIVQGALREACRLPGRRRG